MRGNEEMKQPGKAHNYGSQLILWIPTVFKLKEMEILI